MQKYHKKLHNPYLVLFIISNFLVTVSAGHVPSRFCGKVQIQTPFLNPNSIGLNRIILCKSEKLYFRTSLGLFPISSIDYTTKTLIISHSSSSDNDDDDSRKYYVSPSLLSAGFPPTPHLINSLLLFNCSAKRNLMPTFIRNCSGLHVNASHEIDPDSCLLVDDLEKLDRGFHPKDLSCSHYRRVHRRSLDDKEVGLGTRVSYDIPDHQVPDICKQCEKMPNGNCGVGLRCICHAKDCKDKVISLSGSLNPTTISNVIFSLFSFTAVMVF